MILDIKFDDQGLIIQTNNDGGDSAARTGELYTGLFLNNVANESIQKQFSNALNLLEPNKDGVVLRYNKEPYNHPFNNDFATSRDQTDPMVIAAGFYKDKGFVKKVFISNLKRFFRYPNKDSMLFNLGTYIRAGFSAGYKWLAVFYPVLCVLDSYILINTLFITQLKAKEPGPIRKFLANKLGMYFLVQDYKGDPNNPGSWSVHGKTNVGDDILHTQVVLQSTFVLATPISWLSRLIYSKRPYGVQYAFDFYHRSEAFGNPINEIYRPLIKEYLE